MKYLILLLFFLPVFSIAQNQQPPIIDVHVHGYSERTYRPMPGAPSSFEEFNAEVKAYFSKYNIVAAVKSGGQYDSALEEIMLQGFELNNFPGIDTTEFKRLIEEKEIQVFGEFLPQFNGLTIADPGFAPYLKICEREGIPVALHTGRGPPGIQRQYPDYRLPLGDPMHVEEVLVKYPRLKVYLMHAGLPFYESTLAIMDSYPQVYCDLGAILWIDRGITPTYTMEFLLKAKSAGFIDRIMFGSDAMYWPYGIEKSIKQLQSFEFLTEEDRRKIFYENAVRFFELEFDDQPVGGK